MTLSVLDTQASILLIQTLPLFSSCRQNGTCFLEGGRGREPGSKRGVKGAGERRPEVGSVPKVTETGEK